MSARSKKNQIFEKINRPDILYLQCIFNLTFIIFFTKYNMFNFG